MHVSFNFYIVLRQTPVISTGLAGHFSQVTSFFDNFKARNLLRKRALLGSFKTRRLLTA